MGVMERYVVRPDASGFKVVDTWTGTPAVIAMDPQRDLLQEDAEHTAALLNLRSETREGAALS